MSDAPKPAISPKMCYIVRIENFRKLLNIFNQFLEKNGAASVIRTRDLTLTKGALYRWSYSSTWRYLYITAYDRSSVCSLFKGGIFTSATKKPRAVTLKRAISAKRIMEWLKFQ